MEKGIRENGSRLSIVACEDRRQGTGNG